MTNLVIDVKKAIRILKYFKITIRVTKNCLSEDLLVFKKQKQKPPK